MIVKELSIANFRKLLEAKYSFNSGFNLIVGKNGSGKTSILDAVYMASTGKSFVASKNINCINFDETYFFVSVAFQEKTEIDQVDYLLGRKNREIKLNGKKLKSFTEIVGKFPALFLNYTLVDLVRGGPEEKREFINHTLIFIDRDYYKELLRYYSLLERRNSLLKDNSLSNGISQKNENYPSVVLMETLSQEMVQVGRKIIDKRRAALKSIESIVNTMIPAVLGENCTISLKYVPSKIDNLVSEISLRDEITKRRTLFGIHLDDIEFELNERGIREFSSLGEAYGIGFALKLAENELIKTVVNKTPILLVDDFFTDLDEIKRERILQIIKNEQVILTSISLNGIPQNIINKSKVIFL
ncbi:MAG: DNA replication/repair protein RecF [Caldisericaceae bacterium]